jgi:hypothetical protein
MCGNGLIRMARMGLQETTAPTPEVQDLYSRPIRTTPVAPLVTGEHRAPRPTADAA